MALVEMWKVEQRYRTVTGWGVSRQSIRTWMGRAPGVLVDREPTGSGGHPGSGRRIQGSRHHTVRKASLGRVRAVGTSPALQSRAQIFTDSSEASAAT